MRLSLVSLFTCLLMGGCATKYAEGFTAEPTVSGLIVVNFHGNAYTSDQLTQQFVLYRSAEVAKSKGAPYFLLYPDLRSATRNRAAALPIVGRGNSARFVTAFVRLASVAEPRALRTDDVLAEFAPVIQNDAAKGKP